MHGMTFTSAGITGRLIATRPRRIAGAVLAAAAIGGVTYGLADSLNLTSDSLGAAQTVVAACQSQTMNATYSAPAYSASLPGYTTATVTVTNVQSACYGKAFRVTLEGASNASLGEVTGTVPSSGSTFTASFGTQPAASVVGVAVVISG